MIDWGKIVTNALSVLVASMFVGAAAIVWNGATTVGDKVSAAENRITAAISILSEEIAINSEELEDIKDLLKETGIYRIFNEPNVNPEEMREEESNEDAPPSNNRRDIKQQSMLDKIDIKQKSLK